MSDKIGRLIQQVGRNWRRAVDGRMAPLGLTEATWLPLLYLHRSGPVRQGELAEYLGLDRSSVVRLVDALTVQGLVERRDVAGDRRAKRIQLTERATPVVRAAQVAATAVRAQALSGLPPEALGVAEEVLETILLQLSEPAEAVA